MRGSTAPADRDEGNQQVSKGLALGAVLCSERTSRVHNGCRQCGDWVGPATAVECTTQPTLLPATPCATPAQAAPGGSLTSQLVSQGSHSSQKHTWK